MAKELLDYSGPIVTRAEARKNGLNRYFTGKRCINGHLDQRTTKGTKCLSCLYLWKMQDVDGIARRRKREVERRNDIKAIMAGSERPTSCDVCGPTDKKIRWDHCHYTGKFRGWICTRCNVVLGYANDSAELLRKLADYVEKNGEANGQEKKFPSSTDVCRAEGQKISSA